MPGLAIAHGKLAPGKEFPPAMAEPGVAPTVPTRGSTNVYRGVEVFVAAVEAASAARREKNNIDSRTSRL